MAHTYTFPFSGRTVTWTGGTGAYGAGPDGVLLIQASGRGPVIVTAYTPAWDSSTGYHGAVVGLPGASGKGDYSFDWRMSVTGARNDVPFAIPLGQSAVMVQSKPASEMPSGTWTPTGYSANPSRSVIKYMDAIVVVPYDPTNAATTSLSPPVIGTGSVATFLRSFDVAGLGIPQALLGYSKLPSVVDLDAIATTLSVSVTLFDTLKTDLETIFANFMGDIYSGWSTDTATPGMQHPGYGTYLQSCVSQALLLLASTRYNTAQKTALARSMAQAGLHLTAAMFDGRTMIANGGHCQGRKALVCFFGYLTGISEFTYLADFFLTTSNTTPFREDACYRYLQWFAGAAAGEPWSAAWAYNSTGTSNANGALLANDPTNGWGNPAVWGSWASLMGAYMPPTVGSDLGTALFFTLAGIPRAWSEFGTQFCEQWMDPDVDGSPVDTAMVAIGLDFGATTPAWGEDYLVAPAVPGFTAAAWNAHYATAKALLGDDAPGTPEGVAKDIDA